MAQQSHAWQVKRGKAQIATARDDLAGGVVNVGDDAGAAAHVDHLGFRSARLIKLQIKGSVEEGKVGKQSGGAYATGQFEQIVVGLAGIVIDAFLNLEYLNRKDGGFAVPQARFGSQQNIAGDHPAFRGNIRAVIDRAKGNLGASPAMHGVKIVNQRFHCLISGFVGFFARFFRCEQLRTAYQFRIKLTTEQSKLFRPIGFVGLNSWPQIQSFGNIGADHPDQFRDAFAGVQ